MKLTNIAFQVLAAAGILGAAGCVAALVPLNPRAQHGANTEVDALGARAPTTHMTTPSTTTTTTTTTTGFYFHSEPYCPFELNATLHLCEYSHCSLLMFSFSLRSLFCLRCLLKRKLVERLIIKYPPGACACVQASPVPFQDILQWTGPGVSQSLADTQPTR